MSNYSYADQELKAASLFAGIGGFCLGFNEKQIKTVWAIENDPTAVVTYKLNIENAQIIENNEKPASIEDVSVFKHNLEPVDILHAGFPCQSFSQAGEKRGFEDPRGKLFFEIIRIITEFKDRKPSVVILENAPYLRSGEGGAWFLEISNAIKKAGYWFRESNSAELDTYDLTELPQKRKRLFMVAFSNKHFKNGKYEFPRQTNNEQKKLHNYIDFYGCIEDDSYYLPKDNRYYQMISRVANGEKCIYQLRKYLVRVKDQNICPTLTANMGLGGHNVPFIFDSKGLRKLTEIECLKLQGFPTSFKFPDCVPRNKRYVHIGNSVAPPIASLIADGVKEKIIKERC